MAPCKVGEFGNDVAVDEDELDAVRCGERWLDMVGFDGERRGMRGGGSSQPVSDVDSVSDAHYTYTRITAGLES